MSTPFDYIPEVLNRAVEDAQPIDVKGRVIQVVGTIIKASVPGVKVGEICILRNPWEDHEVQAEVVGFTRDAVLLTALGTMIGISAEDMLDLYDIRLHLEGEAARRAAVNITDEQLGELLELTELQRFYINKQGNSSSEHTKNLDSQFHVLLYTSCGSKAYIDVLTRIHKKMTKFRMASVSKRSRALQSNDEHMAIYQALAAHDPDKAEQAVLTHVRNAMSRMEHMEPIET